MNAIEKKFEQMGARVKVRPTTPDRWGRMPLNGQVRLNVLKDKKGTYFDIVASPDVEVSVLDVQPKDRHLLVMARVPPQPGENQHQPDRKSKFLCGHDERDWFVAAVPESRPVSTVTTAMEALKPQAVLASQSTKKMKKKDKKKRHTEAYLRQGEWFFLPAKNFSPDAKLILTNEPLQRGRGKPHMAQYLVRQGGETVYVNHSHPNGISQAAYNQLSPSQKKMPWRVMRRDAGVYVKGSIRHADHKTLILDGWYRVVPNTETESQAMRHVAFLD